MALILLKTYQTLCHCLTGYRLTRFQLIRAMRDRVREYLTETSAGETYEVNGFRLALPPSDVGIGIDGVLERHVTEYVKRRVREGMTVIDVGAHIGYFTTLMGGLVGRHGRVIAFEPELHNLGYLRRNVGLNALPQVVIVDKAVTDKSRIVRLVICSSNTGGHTVRPDANEPGGITVEGVALDDFVHSAGIGCVDFIKMDIEGGEYLALIGMRDTLKNNKNVGLLMEFSPRMLEAAGAVPIETLKFLEGEGFRLYDVVRGLLRGTSETITRRYVDKDWNGMIVAERG